jgi:Fe-S-cluster formation regulator IscX/YfhJ
VADDDKAQAALEERNKVLEAELKRARDEAAERRVKLNEYEEADKKRTDAERAADEERAKKAGDYEKVIAEHKAENEALKRSNSQKEAAARKRVVAEALRARLADAVDPDVVKLVDIKDVKVDPETFEVTGLDEIVSAFRESKPHFFGKAVDAPKPGSPVPPKPGGGGDAPSDWRGLTDDAFKAKMNSEFGIVS